MLIKYRTLTHFLFFFHLSHSKKYKFAWNKEWQTTSGWNRILEVIRANVSAPAGLCTAGCPGPCPDGFLLNISNKGYPTASQGNLYQFSVTLTEKSVSWCSDGMPCVSVFPPHLWSISGHHWKEPNFLFIFHSDIFIQWWLFPLRLLSPRLKVLSLFFYDRWSNLFIIFVSFVDSHCWTLFSMSSSLLFWGAQNWAWYSRSHQCWMKGKDLLLILLTTFLLMHPGIALVCLL